MKRLAALSLLLLLGTVAPAVAQFQVPAGCLPVGRGPAASGFLSGCVNIGDIRQLNLRGSSSGVISLKGQAAAGTFNFNLPITAGASGQYLTSQGGGATAMIWQTPTTYVSSVALTAPGIFTVTGSPITGAGTLGLVAAGTSGGVPYFNTATTLATSAALTANLPVIGGGAGLAPTVGTRSGNTTAFATVSGAFVNGHCLQVDGSGNIVDAGGACTTGGGGGTVSSGTANQMAYYASTGTTISGNPNVTVTNGDVINGVTGVTLGTQGLAGNTSGLITIKPQAVAGTYNFNLPTAAGTAGQPLLSGGGVAAAQTYGTLGVAAGGTGLTAGTSGGILAFTAAGTLASSVALTANLPVIGGGAGVAPTVGTRSGNTTAYVTTTGAQTSGNCVSIDASGNHIAAGVSCSAANIAVGGSTISSGTTGRILYDNAGVVGEMTTTGTGTQVALSTSPAFTTPNLGTPSAGVLTNTTGLPLTTAVTGTLPVANGGTGNTTATNHSIPINQGTGAQANTGAGTNGQALVSQGASADPVWKSGMWVLLNTLTASDSAALSDTTSFTSTFNEYQLVLENVLPSTNGASLVLHVRSGGTFQTTSYIGMMTAVNNGGTTTTSSMGAANINFSIASVISNAAANGGVSGSATVFAPLGTTSPKSWIGTFEYGTGSATSQTATIGGRWNNTAAVDGFEVKFFVGNITSGVVKVYGRL